MAKPPRGFARFLRRGAKLLKNPGLLRRVLSQAMTKSDQADSGPLAQVKEQLLRLIALLKAYAAGEYRDVSTQTMIVVAAAVAYFVVPFDAVPDFLFGWGLVDDAAVISYVAAQIASELAAFARWQEAQKQQQRQASDKNLPAEPTHDDPD